MDEEQLSLNGKLILLQEISNIWQNPQNHVLLERILHYYRAKCALKGLVLIR